MNNSILNTSTLLPKIIQEAAFAKRYAENAQSNAAQSSDEKLSDNSRCSIENSCCWHDFFKLFNAQNCNNEAENKTLQTKQEGSPDFTAALPYKTASNNAPHIFQQFSQFYVNVHNLETFLGSPDRLILETIENSNNAIKRDLSNISSTNCFLLYLCSQMELRMKKRVFKKKIFRDPTYKDTDSKKNYAACDPDDFDELLAF